MPSGRYVASMTDVWTYVDAVSTGKRRVGKLERLAVERFVHDWEHGRERGLQFREEAATHFFQVAAGLVHTKGEWARKPLRLEPWQAFAFANIYGWHLSDGTRRFQTAYIQVAKKNGKTLMGCAVGTYGLAFDGEEGAEVYSIATKEAQAKLSWLPAKRMLQLSSELRDILEPRARAIVDPESASTWMAMGADSDTSDGPNPSTLLTDELHAHKNGDLFNNYRMSMGTRVNPLTFIMTTAGAGRESFCYSFRNTCIKVLERQREDDRLFALIYEPDEGDDWREDSTWEKANPNLDVSVKRSFIRSQCHDAQGNPRLENDFRRYHCDEWTEQVVRWLPMDRWDACTTVDTKRLEEQVAWWHQMHEALRGEACFGSFDLSRRHDMTAFGKLFPPENGRENWTFLPRYWIPQEKVEAGSQLEEWHRAGLLEICPGPTIDFNRVEARIRKDAQTYRIVELPHDRWSATDIAKRLDEAGLPMVEFGQGYKSMSAPSKLLEAIVLNAELEHGGHPILRWNAANAVVETDSAENIKPTKDPKKISGRIDGLITLVMALGRAMQYSESGVFAWSLE